MPLRQVLSKLRNKTKTKRDAANPETPECSHVPQVDEVDATAAGRSPQFLDVMSTGRKPYPGARRKLLVGIDVGTTFSGVSYSILDPGVVPIIQGVYRFPAQENAGGDAKVPSIMYYDRAGQVRAAGAEAVLEANVERAREEQWIKAEWFKLYLRPRHLKLPSDEYLPPLPLNKTAVQVFGDFLRYLYDCTRVFIEETHSGSAEFFNSLKDTAELVLSHPNGWEGAQQAQMRQAAISAGLVPDLPAGRSRVRFVTEGEASIHYCIGNGYASDMIKGGEGIIVVDAGGGTIDLSAFHLDKDANKFEEVASTACLFQGSVFVSRRARVFFENLLYDSRYGSPDDIDQITDAFDKSTKLVFKDPNETAFIKFGTWRDTDEMVNIKSGQLKIAGTNVATFFEETIVAIENAVQQQKDAALIPVTSVLLVGGFAASGWLFSNLQNRLLSKGLRLRRPDGHLGKAVADGAVSFVVDHFISARIAKSNFGVKYNVFFSKNDPEHQHRSGTVYTDLSGNLKVPNAFKVILAKGTRVSETTPFRRSFHRKFSTKLDINTETVSILVYKGTALSPRWVDEEPDMFTKVSWVRADVQQAVEALSPRVGPCGTYYHFHYDIEILFGLVEFEAYICWEENGIEKRSPASIVYDG